MYKETAQVYFPLYLDQCRLNMENYHLGLFSTFKMIPSCFHLEELLDALNLLAVKRNPSIQALIRLFYLEA